MRLTGTLPQIVHTQRQLFLRIPTSPRCEQCAVPFAGPFAPFLRLLGWRRFTKNPRFCGRCVGQLMSFGPGGAEIPVSFLFADVRGSTPLTERLGATGMHKLVDRFYETGVDSLIAFGALVDRFQGDRVNGFFVPAFAGPNHARQAALCALQLLRETGHGRPEGPWIPVGAGVHTGVAFVGSVGRGGEDLVELTAIGDIVNIGARLADVAAAGELVISQEAFAAAELGGDPERRELTLKGVSTPVPVRVLGTA